MYKHFLLVICLFSFILLILPLTANHDPLHAYSGQELQQPSRQFFLGTDQLGRDVWSRLVVGGQRTLSAALLATLIAISGGLLLSIAYSSPWIHFVTGVLIDALLAFPALLTALVLRTLLPASVWSLSLALGLSGVAVYARVASDAIQVAGTAPHIEGAHSIGASQWRIITRHMLPVAMPALLSFGSVMFGWMVLYQAALAFLGLGGDPSAPDWGIMLNQGRSYVQQAPLMVLAPGMMIALIVWLANRGTTQMTRP